MHANELIVVVDVFIHYYSLSGKCAAIEYKLYIYSAIGFLCLECCCCSYVCSGIILKGLACSLVNCCSCYLVCLTRYQIPVRYLVNDMDVLFCKGKLCCCLFINGCCLYGWDIDSLSLVIDILMGCNLCLSIKHLFKHNHCCIIKTLCVETEIYFCFSVSCFRCKIS